METRWPDADLAAKARGGSWLQGAAICRRGHVEATNVQPQGAAEIANSCSICGAALLTGCTNCGMRIRGKRYMRRVITTTPTPRPSFCDDCGAAHPWATREERIFELENLLDQEEIDPADRVVIQDQLTRLRDSTISDKDERQAWKTISEKSGAALKSGPVQRVMEGVVSAAIRASIGL